MSESQSTYFFCEINLNSGVLLCRYAAISVNNTVCDNEILLRSYLWSSLFFCMYLNAPLVVWAWQM